MDRLDAMMLFVTAAEEGSLAKAARRLGRSAAGASRAIAMLEAQAGEPLLLRSTRGLRLTVAGEHRLSVWRDVLARLDATTGTTGIGTVSGDLTIAAPEMFGRLELLPHVLAFGARHPQVRTRLRLANRLVDLLAERVDVAIRLARLDDSSLAAVHLGDVRRLTCAAPAYLDRHGRPATPVDLADHLCIGLEPDTAQELWSFARTGRRTADRAVPVPTRLSVDNAAAALDAALQGYGIIRVMSYQVAKDLAAGRLVTLLDEFEPAPAPVNAIFRRHPPRWSATRAFVDEALPSLRSRLTALSTGSGPGKPA